MTITSLCGKEQERSKAIIKNGKNKQWKEGRRGGRRKTKIYEIAEF